MTVLQTALTGLRAVRGNRLRSLLTALGILIGVGALIITVGIGLGTRTSIGSRISRLGTNLITVTPGSVTSGGVRTGLGSSTTLTMDDAAALGDRSVAPDVAGVAPVVSRNNAIMVAGPVTWTSSVTGSTPDWLLTNARYVDSGSFITNRDVRDHAHVAVLGPTTAANLFPGGNAIGSLVDIQHVPFRVIGILQPRGAQGLFNPDDLAVVPISTAQGELITGGSLTSVQRILVSADSRDAIDSATEEVDDLLLQTHRITDPAQADFTITTQASILSTLDATSTALTLLLAGVAGISLLVGGIGVMNIMLVSVTERIAEIGLRKALGARRSDILRQFLLEAAVISAVGGLLGVGLGGASTFALDRFTSLVTVFSPPVAAIGLMIAAGIGLVFGVLPALRAARLEPIVALRGS
ncbi:MAG: FtsX-like permease family protein [Chloroflexi bacterium]|nr:MAG: FtsX-like permease family protein [Chloroflexota bacterium]